MRKMSVLILTLAVMLCGCTKAPSLSAGEKEILKPGAVVDAQCKTIVSDYTGDLDGDGTEDIITLYTSAQKEAGEILWDDMQKWCLIAQVNGDAYELYCGNVSIGEISYNVYENTDGKLVISVTEESTATYTLTQYEFTDNGFEKNVIIDDQGINLMTSSHNV